MLVDNCSSESISQKPHEATSPIIQREEEEKTKKEGGGYRDRQRRFRTLRDENHRLCTNLSPLRHVMMFVWSHVRLWDNLQQHFWT